MSNDLEIFVDTTKQIHSLDIPSKAMAERLVRSAMNMVAIDLQNNNITGAIETKNKYESIEHWFKRQHATLITQNTVAVGRLELIRQIGAYIRDNYEHIGGNQNKDKNGKFISKDLVITREEQGKYLKDLPISSATYLKWMDAADIEPDEFNQFVLPYLDESVKDDIDGIFLGTVLSHFYPSKYNDVDAPNLPPSLKKVWLLGRDYMDALSDMIIDCGDGNVPADHVTKVFEQMDKVTTANREAKKYIRDAYKGN
jgi:hypothetical protein